MTKGVCGSDAVLRGNMCYVPGFGYMNWIVGGVIRHGLYRKLVHTKCCLLDCYDWYSGVVLKAGHLISFWGWIKRYRRGRKVNKSY